MIKKGLLEETEKLIQKGLESWRPLKSLGYKQALDCLQGKIKKQELEERIIAASLSLAKRQRTWFKKDKEIHWLLKRSPVQNKKLYFENKIQHK